MTGSVELDESGFPVAPATFRGTMSREVLSAYFARVDVWCREGRRHAMILDISRCDVSTAAERKLIADGMAAHHARISRSCVGTAVVLTSPLLRGAVTAILWAQPKAPRHAVVATREEAHTFCTGWLAPAPLSCG